MKRRIALVALTLALASCSSEPTSPETDSSPTSATETVAETQADETQAEESEPDTEPLDLPDPHTITGVSEVAPLSDPEPIDGDFPQNLPVTITDDEGHEVTITDTSRLLALDLNGTLTRTIIALGHGDSLVGRTVSSTETQLADLPIVTHQGHLLNAEAILSLRPTLVIADRTVGPPEVIDQVKQAGIPVVIVSSERTLETNSESMQVIADILGVPEAGQALVERTETEIAEAQEQIAAWTPDDPVSAAFLYVRGTAGVFFVFGSDQGATSLISEVGARDIASEVGIVGTVPANAESLLLMNPDVIFTMTDGLESTNGIEGLLSRPGVGDTTAGQNQRVIAIPDGIALSFGPQTGEILINIAAALYGVDQ